MRPHEASDN